MKHLAKISNNRLVSFDRLSIAMLADRRGRGGDEGVIITRAGNVVFYSFSEAEYIWDELCAYADSHDHVLKFEDVIIDSRRIQEAVFEDQRRNWMTRERLPTQLKVDNIIFEDEKAVQIWNALSKVAKEG